MPLEGEVMPSAGGGWQAREDRYGRLPRGYA